MFTIFTSSVSSVFLPVLRIQKFFVQFKVPSMYLQKFMDYQKMLQNKNLSKKIIWKPWRLTISNFSFQNFSKHDFFYIVL